jgi:1,4-dihydroxy-2-naphthoyl-CoA synthase
MDFEDTKSDGVAILTLNRPRRRDAFTIETIALWDDALVEAQRDQDAGATVVTGVGGAFSSGFDLGEFTAGNRTPLAQKRFLTGGVHRVALALQDVTKPVLAAVTGPAMAAGLDKRAVRRGADHDLRTSLDLVSSPLAMRATTLNLAEAFAQAQARRPDGYVGR